MASQPLAFGAIFGGALLLVAGLTDSTLASVAQGKPDHAHKGAGGSTSSTGEGGGSIGGASGAPAGAAPDPRTLKLTGAEGASNTATGSKRYLQAYVRVFSKRVGWNASDWEGVIERESGWNPAATNPSSGAYGIGQFLGSTKDAYAHLGATSPNPTQQINAMAAYIRDRYGNPTAALAHERAYGWY